MVEGRTVTIDCFPESVARYRQGYAVVSVDVIRASTTAVTAVATGRRCFPVPSLATALSLAARLDHPLLAGEQAGRVPAGFEMNNSPAETARRNDVSRPMILLSSAGSRLIHGTAECERGYVSCFRNHRATVEHVAGRHPHVAVIGAGSRGQFREEDQMCCAWIAEALTQLGYRPANDATRAIVRRWSGQPPQAWIRGASAAFLRSSGQSGDLDFIVSHFDDLDFAVAMRDDEAVRIPPGPDG